MATREWLDNAFWHDDSKTVAEAILVINTLEEALFNLSRDYPHMKHTIKHMEDALEKLRKYSYLYDD